MASSQMRLSGINSGFDTEAMIEQMMSAYQTKIDKQNQKLQKLQWQQEQYRDITSKLNTFKGKYFDLLKRDTYLMSPTSFNKFDTKITTKSGKDSGLKVTTDSKSTAGDHKIKIDRLATAAVTKGGQVSSENFKLDVHTAIENATADENGKYNFALDIKVGNVAKTVEFSGADKDELLASLNTELVDAFGTTSGGNAFISATDEGGMLKFSTTGNSLATVTERTGNFGMSKPAEIVEIDCSAALTGTSALTVTVPSADGATSITKRIEFETVSDTYFDGKDDDETIKNDFMALKKQAYAAKKEVAISTVTEEMMDNDKFIYTSAQAACDKNEAAMLSALNGAFKQQGVEFELDGSALSAKFTEGDSKDKAAAFTVVSACDATFGLKKGSATSYINESTKLSDMGLATDVNSDDGNYFTMTVNGKEIKVGEDATVSDLMEAVNKSDAGVTLTYSKLEGSFTLTANDKGNGGDVEISGALADALKLSDTTRVSHTEGTNAVFTIDGVTVEHNDNVYEMDGVKYDFSDVDPADGELISVSVDKTYDGIKQTIKDFVKDYNQMIDDINGYTQTARPKDKNKNYYEPLTSEEKEAMSEDEVKKWEEAAKKGLLYHDSTVTSVMSRIRIAMYSGVETEDGGKFGLYSMGIKVMSTLDEGGEEGSLAGKLKIDEDALDKAFEEHAEDVIKLFTDSENGVMSQVNKAIESAVKTSSTEKNKGTLIRKAGLATGNTSKDNLIYKEMERINKRIEQLQDRYDKKEEYWWTVFTNLEKMQAQFSAQQNYIAQFTASGGYLSSQ